MQYYYEWVIHWICGWDSKPETNPPYDPSAIEIGGRETQYRIVVAANTTR